MVKRGGGLGMSKRWIGGGGGGGGAEKSKEVL